MCCNDPSYKFHPVTTKREEKEPEESSILSTYVEQVTEWVLYCEHCGTQQIKTKEQVEFETHCRALDDV